MRFIITYCLWCLVVNLFAQDGGYTTSATASGRTLKQFQDANALWAGGERQKAIEKLATLAQREPLFIDAPANLAEWYYETGRINDAISAFEQVIALDTFHDTRILYSLGRMYLSIGEYSRSASLFLRYLEVGRPDSKQRDRTLAFLEKAEFGAELVANPVQFEPEPVPGPINTRDGEALPAFTVDGQYMFFTRKSGMQEDMYLAFWDTVTGAWSNPEYLTAVNTPANEGAHAVSADGSTIAFTACGRSDGAGSCDLYFWRRVDGTWLRPMNAGGINSSSWDGHPALTPDGRGMYFSSDRPGGMGGKDLWYTERHGELWTKPVNLGSDINTPGDEESPFLFFDGRTLYFMSDGHPGLGSSDLFVSTRTGNRWSKPKNLGYPINTYHREGAFAIHPNREYAYFTSDKINGQNDLYRFRLDSTLLPPPVSNLLGQITDADDGNPLIADLVIYDLADSSEAYIYKTSADGIFSAVLTHGRKYGIHASAEGYVFWSGQFALDSSAAYQKKTIKIALSRIATDPGTGRSAPVILKNIEFAFGSAVLLPTSLPELRRLLLLMQNNPEMRIEIRGHTDHVGSEEENKILSEARANAVKDWLIENGIAAERLYARGFGEALPLSSNDTEEGRQENRRVEFVIIKS